MQPVKPTKSNPNETWHRDLTYHHDVTYQNYDLSIYQSLKLFELRVSCSPWVDQGSCFWTFHCQRTKKKEGRFCNCITTTIGLKHRNRSLLKADQGSWSFHQNCQRTKKKEGRFCKRDTNAIGKKTETQDRKSSSRPSWVQLPECWSALCNQWAVPAEYET